MKLEQRGWEIRHCGATVGVDGSREYAFRIAENHHREVLRTRDLRVFGSVGVGSALALLTILLTSVGSVLGMFALAAVWFVHVWAVIGFVYSLARVGRLRGGARYGTPFGKSTYRALRRASPRI